MGQHPLVSRLMKEIFYARPSRPRYTHTWDINNVLTYIKTLGQNASLSLNLLSRKLAVLLALVLAHRCSDLVRLSAKGIKFSADGADIQCKGLSKTGRPGQEKIFQAVTI